MAKTVHLCGLGPGWTLCPPVKEGRMIWGMNNLVLRREVNYLFEVHDFEEKFHRLGEGLTHQAACQAAVRKGIPYIVREKWDFLPGLKQIVYPWEGVFNMVGSDNLGCTLDCMIALAVYCGYKDIQVYGQGANKATFYDYQVPSNNYWIGVCHGAKINIKFHNLAGLRHTDIMRTSNGRVYGLDIPQRPWPTIDTTLPACNCTKRHGNPCRL